MKTDLLYIIPCVLLFSLFIQIYPAFQTRSTSLSLFLGVSHRRFNYIFLDTSNSCWCYYEQYIRKLCFLAIWEIRLLPTANSIFFVCNICMALGRYMFREGKVRVQFIFYISVRGFFFFLVLWFLKTNQFSRKYEIILKLDISLITKIDPFFAKFYFNINKFSLLGQNLEKNNSTLSRAHLYTLDGWLSQIFIELVKSQNNKFSNLFCLWHLLWRHHFWYNGLFRIKWINVTHTKYFIFFTGSKYQQI